jgi:hypothetical protein
VGLTAKKGVVRSSDMHNSWLNRGLMVEAVDPRSGEIRWKIEVPESKEHWYDLDQRTVDLFGPYLVMHGTANNSVIYRMSDGQRLGAFYGRVIAGDGALGLVAATNRDQEVILIDAANGHELKRVTLDQFPRAARFIPEKKELLVLTASQRVYTLELPARPTALAGAKR